MSNSPTVVVHGNGQQLPGATRRRPAKRAKRQGDQAYVAIVATLALSSSTLALFDAYLMLTMFAG